MGGKNHVPEIFMPCNGSVEVFLRAAGAFFSGKQWLTNGFDYICDGRGLMKAHSLKELAFINGSGFWLCLGPICDAIDYPPARGAFVDLLPGC